MIIHSSILNFQNLNRYCQKIKSKISKKIKKQNKNLKKKLFLSQDLTIVRFHSIKNVKEGHNMRFIYQKMQNQDKRFILLKTIKVKSNDICILYYLCLYFDLSCFVIYS